MIRTVPVVLSLLLTYLTACQAQTKSDAEKLARVLKGDDKNSAANNPVCKLFTKAEASAYIRATVKTFVNAAGGSGCQWEVGDGNGRMLIQVVPQDYFESPSRMKGYKELPDLGRKGFVAPDQGWTAGAIIKGEGVYADIDSKGATEAKAIELFKETLKRRAAAGTAK